MTTLLDDPTVPATDPTTLGTAPTDLRADLRRWKDEVLAAIRTERPVAPAAVVTPSAASSYVASTAYDDGGTAVHTKQAVAEMKHAVKTDVANAKHKTEMAIADQPLKSIGIAAAVGFVLGVCWNRRR